MNTLIELLDRMAWPLVVVLVAIILRESLSQLIMRTKHVVISWGESKEAAIRFRGIMEHVRDNLREELEDPADNKKHVSRIVREDASGYPDIESLAKAEPYAAILVAWKRLEQDLYTHMQTHDIEPVSDLYENLKAMKKEELLDDINVEIITDLYEARNAAAHASIDTDRLTTADAESYVQTTRGIRKLLPRGLMRGEYMED